MARMERDMDLVLKILFAIEERKPDGHIGLSFEGISDEKVGYHVYLLHDAGLVHGINATSADDSLPNYLPAHLTWQGHEFLDASRDPGRWEKAKNILGKIGGGSFKIVLQILTKIMSDEATEIMHEGGG